MEFDFSKNSTVASLDAVPADFQGLYKADGDKFVLDSTDAKVKSAVSAITGLNNALKSARAEAKNKQTVDLTPLSEFGTEPVAIKAAITTKLEALTEQIKGVNPAKMKEDLAKEFKVQIDAANGKSATLEKQLYEELVVSKASSAVAEVKADPDLLLPFIQKQVKVAEKDGKLQVHVLDAAGDIRYSGVTGAPMSIKELVAEMKANAKYGTLFPSEAAKGGGANPAATQRAAAAKNQAANGAVERSSTQKISDGLKAGLAKKA